MKQRLQNDLTTAIKARDELRSATIRLALAAIKTEEVAGKEARELSEAEIIQVLSREAKKRKEAAEVYRGAGAEDRAKAEEAELAVLSEYLPQALSAAELEQIVKSAVAEVVATGLVGMKAMGAVMKIVQPQTLGRADGAEVASLVKKLLS
ncbi:MAG: GatB/YqeY domain-containing protein [Actinobacteria bacterium]|nr:GatB/YqeY domain-containing protein [Actinomycetota bacterium]